MKEENVMTKKEKSYHREPFLNLKDKILALQESVHNSKKKGIKSQLKNNTGFRGSSNLVSIRLSRSKQIRQKIFRQTRYNFVNLSPTLFLQKRRKSSKQIRRSYLEQFQQSNKEQIKQNFQNAIQTYKQEERQTKINSCKSSLFESINEINLKPTNNIVINYNNSISQIYPQRKTTTPKSSVIRHTHLPIKSINNRGNMMHLTSSSMNVSPKKYEQQNQILKNTNTKKFANYVNQIFSRKEKQNFMFKNSLFLSQFIKQKQREFRSNNIYITNQNNGIQKKNKQSFVTKLNLTQRNYKKRVNSRKLNTNQKKNRNSSCENLDLGDEEFPFHNQKIVSMKEQPVNEHFSDKKICQQVSQDLNIPPRPWPSQFSQS